MTEQHDNTGGIVMRVGGVILAWLGSWKVGELQALAGIASALCVGGYAALQGYVLWRDKIKGQ